MDGIDTSGIPCTEDLSPAALSADVLVPAGRRTRTLHSLRRGHAAQVITFEPPRTRSRFTCRDLLELNGWHAEGHRLEVDGANDGMDQFALVYCGSAPWAHWAISREVSSVLLWDCITHADIGRFATVRAALEAIPGAGPAVTYACARPSATITPLRGLVLGR